MKKKIAIIFCLSFLFLITCSATKLASQDYRSCVLRFYKILMTRKTISVGEMESIYLNSSYEKSIRGEMSANTVIDSQESRLFYKLMNYKNQLTQGVDYKTICSLINNSNVINEGFEFGSFIELKFPNNKTIFFDMNSDIPKTIEYIWLPSGEDLGSLIMNYEKVEKFLRPGIINDSDGFTNLRKETNGNSKIIGRLLNNQLFFYSPNSYSNWWAIYRKDNSFEKPMGYIHKSKIKPYERFPNDIKNQLKKIRHGC